MVAILFIAVCFVAFTNGANANFKGVASLYGSVTTSLRHAMYWGTVTTFAGSIVAMYLATGLMKKFGGRGIVPDELAQSPDFSTSVAMGAALTSWIASRFGFPVSTTHALVGSIIGAGLAGSGWNVQFTALGNQVVYPLLFSPLVAIALGASLYCLLNISRLLPEASNNTLNALHYLSTGAASFARGLNDTPKMAALLLLIPEISNALSVWLVAIAIATGGLLGSQAVAETLGKKITGMNPSQGFAASLVTAGLVSTASWHSLPVSTTHVSVGSLIGIGAATGQAKWLNVGGIFFAWISTVPCGAIIASLVYGSLSLFR